MPAMKIFSCLPAFVVAVPALLHAEERKNYFDDPFVQVSSSIQNCPQPAPPGFTEAQVREVAHVRAQHGGSCYRAGRCRLPNSYLYDKEIIPRVALYLQQDGRFADTSLWILGERRLVTVFGCVNSAEQSQALEGAINLVDDVMGVINLTMVGVEDKPPYKLVPAGSPSK